MAVPLSAMHTNTSVITLRPVKELTTLQRKEKRRSEVPTPKPFTAQSVFKTVADAYLLTPPIDNCLKVQLPKPALNLKIYTKK